MDPYHSRGRVVSRFSLFHTSRRRGNHHRSPVVTIEDDGEVCPDVTRQMDRRKGSPLGYSPLTPVEEVQMCEPGPSRVGSSRLDRVYSGGVGTSRCVAKSRLYKDTPAYPDPSRNRRSFGSDRSSTAYRSNRLTRYSNFQSGYNSLYLFFSRTSAHRCAYESPFSSHRKKRSAQYRWVTWCSE